MAYTRRIVFECSEQGCSKTGTHQVFNNRNAPYATFCERHAKAFAKDLESRENAGEQMPSR